MEAKLAKLPTTYSKKRSALEAQLESLEVLITGNSLAYQGIRPDIMKRPAYNLANMSQSLVVDAMLIEKYLERLPKLRLIVMPVAYYSFGYLLAANPVEHWRNLCYVRFFGISGDRSYFDLFRPDAWSLFLLYGPERALEYAGRNFEVSLDVAQGTDRFGFWPRYGSSSTWNSTLAAVDAEVRAFDRLYDAENVVVVKQALRKVVKTAAARGVKVVLVTTPASPVFLSRIEPQRLAAFYEQFKSTCSELGVRCVDYSRDRRFASYDFFDVAHLDFKGAGKFSRILDAEVVQ